MPSTGPYIEPSEVSVEQGLIIVEGPNGVALTLTPEAAEETGKRLLSAVLEAKHRADPGPA